MQETSKQAWLTTVGVEREEASRPGAGAGARDQPLPASHQLCRVSL